MTKARKATMLLVRTPDGIDGSWERDRRLYRAFRRAVDLLDAGEMFAVRVSFERHDVTEIICARAERTLKRIGRARPQPLRV